MARGIFLDRGRGKIYSARGSTMTFKALHDNTNGAFSLMERSLPIATRRPQSHPHKGLEGFYVLAGRIEFIVGGESRTGGPGFWALAPSRVSHTFGNVGDSPARLLIIHSPAADAYFAELEACGKIPRPHPRKNEN